LAIEMGSGPGPARVAFTWAGVRAGAAGAGAVAASVFAFGIAFGVLADQRGLTLAAALAMSGTVYAGSAQIVALQLWATPVPLIPVWAAALAVNARYVLMGAALRPWLARLAPLRAYGSLFVMADGNWALAMRERAAGRLDAAYLLGGGLAMYVSWVAATGLGHALGQFVGAPRRLGLDFMLAAFCTTTAVALWRGRRDVWPMIAAALVAIASERLIPGHWHILTGGLAGSLVGAWRHVDPA
jgi:branched chain amino acid efflux pump